MKPEPHLKPVGGVLRHDGKPIAPEDLAVTIGWGGVQVRTLNSGATSHAVMPGDGLTTQRLRTKVEESISTDRDFELLGDEVIDVHLNDDVCWRGVPQAAWDFKVGGFQILRKWLSYREQSVLGRPLSLDEARQFTSIARRLTQLVLLADQLDANYRAATGAVDQDPLPELNTAA